MTLMVVTRGKFVVLVERLFPSCTPVCGAGGVLVQGWEVVAYRGRSRGWKIGGSGGRTLV